MANPNDDFSHLDLDLDALGGQGDSKTPEEIAAEEAAAREAEAAAEAEKKKKEEEDEEEEEEETAEQKAAREAAEAAGEEEEEEGNDDSFITQIRGTFGFEELDEEEFEDSEEGLIALTQKASELMTQRSLKQMFEADPVLAKHFEFKQQGGDSAKFMETFYPSNDWTKVELSDEPSDTTQHELVMKTDLLERGFTDEQATEMVNDLKVADTLVARSKSALQNLQARQAQKQESLIESQKQAVADNQKKAEDSWKKVNETIKTSKELAGLPIKEAEKQTFYDYLNKPVTKEGLTQRQLDLAKLELDKSLALDFLLFKNFDLSKIVQTKVKTSQANSLRDRLKGTKTTKNQSSSSKKTTDPTKDVVDQIDFSKI